MAPACAVIHGIVAAVKRHGNSDRVALEHYISEMPEEEARDFYSIRPTKPTHGVEYFPKAIPA
jgi:hypothetical protein